MNASRPVKAEIMALITMSFRNDHRLRNTYNEMGLRDYKLIKDARGARYLFDVAADFINWFCLDDVGQYNGFSEPLISAVPPLLDDHGHRVDARRFSELKEHLESGTANADSIKSCLENLVNQTTGTPWEGIPPP